MIPTELLDRLSAHDAAHNLCTVCWVSVVLIDGKWVHNRKGFVADHELVPGGAIFGGCRELPPHEEIHKGGI